MKRLSKSAQSNGRESDFADWTASEWFKVILAQNKGGPAFCSWMKRFLFAQQICVVCQTISQQLHCCVECFPNQIQPEQGLGHLFIFFHEQTQIREERVERERGRED